nr:MAG TPA: hypothetical protein [Caudoviricetes sp.]
MNRYKIEVASKMDNDIDLIKVNKKEMLFNEN